MHRRHQGRARPIEPVALGCREIVLISHIIGAHGSSPRNWARLAPGWPARWDVRTAVRNGVISRQVCTTTTRLPVEASPVVTECSSQLAPECAMLERAEQRVELGQVGAVLGLELVDFGTASGECALQIEWRDW